MSIFEAQPPTEADGHKVLSDDVFHIAKSLLNPYAIAMSQSAAMAQLAIYALGAMASSETLQIIETVQELAVDWFTRRTLRKLRQLRNIWASHTASVAIGPFKLLDEAIQTLDRG